jgi:hypothetical protein
MTGVRSEEAPAMTPLRCEPSDDERAGAAWWTALSEPRKADWLSLADSTRPADAWAEFKRRTFVERPARARRASGRG